MWGGINQRRRPRLSWWGVPAASTTVRWREGGSCGSNFELQSSMKFNIQHDHVDVLSEFELTLQIRAVPGLEFIG